MATEYRTHDGKLLTHGDYPSMARARDAVIAKLEWGGCEPALLGKRHGTTDQWHFEILDKKMTPPGCCGYATVFMAGGEVERVVIRHVV